MKKLTLQQAKQRGFTMIELLIVIAILGLLASLVAPEMIGRADSSKVKTAQTQMEMFQTALDTYRLDTGRYPEQLNDLLEDDARNWQGPYLPTSTLPTDPWNNDYVYRTPGEGNQPFYLASLGADGQPGGTELDADIVHEW